MGRKIFVSYKYNDISVQILDNQKDTKVRDYVTKFEEKLNESDHIYKGEKDDEDLSDLDDDTIWEKLKNRIYDSTVTVIFISPNMKEEGRSYKDQWIPWEVSYSLKETSRKNKNGESITSKTNAMIAVVLPDKDGSYSYYLNSKNCCTSGCVEHETQNLFQIIRDNKFNKKTGNKKECETGSTVWIGESSYITAVKWCDFITNYDNYVDRAIKRQDDIDNYKIVKEIK